MIVVSLQVGIPRIEIFGSDELFTAGVKARVPSPLFSLCYVKLRKGG
jgi:hypothetical protein